MHISHYGKPKTYLHKKVSLNQAMKILRRNGIQADEDQASVILDFHYLLANTYKTSENL